MSIRARPAYIFIWVIAFLLAFCACPTTTFAEGGVVTTTKYSCEPDARNAMTNTPGFCRETWTGGPVHTRGAACPRQWTEEGWWIWVAGEGVHFCDDLSSFSHTTWLGHPHVDIRTPDFEAALRFGIQTRRAKRVFYSYRAPLPLDTRQGRGPF